MRRNQADRLSSRLPTTYVDAFRGPPIRDVYK